MLQMSKLTLAGPRGPGLPRRVGVCYKCQGGYGKLQGQGLEGAV